MTDKKKQIADMAEFIHVDSSFQGFEEDALQLAEELYKAGYRKRVKGEWETRKGERWIGSEVCERYEYYACSRCGKRHDRSRDPYCPGCGAKMKGDESDA